MWLEIWEENAAIVYSRVVRTQTVHGWDTRDPVRSLTELRCTVFVWPPKELWTDQTRHKQMLYGIFPPWESFAWHRHPKFSTVPSALDRRNVYESASFKLGAQMRENLKCASVGLILIGNDGAFFHARFCSKSESGKVKKIKRRPLRNIPAGNVFRKL